MTEPHTMRTDGKAAHRAATWRFLTYSALFGLISLTASTFHQNEQVERDLYIVGFSAASLYMLLSAGLSWLQQKDHIKPGPKLLKLGTGIRWCAWALMIYHLWGAVVVGFLQALGIALIVSKIHFTLIIAADLAVLGLSVRRARRRGGLRPNAVAIGHTMLRLALVTMLLWPVYCFWLFMPPKVSACEANIRPGVVEWISGPEYLEALSTPYRLLHIPEKEILVVPFKMMGNLSFDFWNDPNANKLVVFHTKGSPPYETSVLEYPGTRMPESLAYNPARDEIILTRMGDDNDKHRIDLVDLSTLPHLRRVASFAFVQDAPDDIVVLPEGRRFVVMSNTGRVNVYNRERLELVQTEQIPYSEEMPTTFLLDHTIGKPESSLAYLSIFGQKVVEQTSSADRHALHRSYSGAAIWRWLRAWTDCTKWILSSTLSMSST